MTTNMNFEGLKMTIENYRHYPRVRKPRKENPEDYSMKEYTEQKDFEKVFNVPVKSILKADVEDKIVDLNTGKTIEEFVLPYSYSVDDAQEYNEFLASAFDEIRGNEGYKLMEIRKNKYQKTIITIIKA